MSKIKGNKHKSKDKNDEKIDCYPELSSEVLLEVIRNEYEKERERSGTLDNKSGVFIAAIIAMITVFIPIIPFERLKIIYGKMCIETVIATVFVCVLALSFYELILAFYKLYQTINLKDYKRPRLDAVKDPEIQSQPKYITEYGLIDHFYDIVMDNIDINNAKASQLREGIKRSLYGFILLSFATIGLMITL